MTRKKDCAEFGIWTLTRRIEDDASTSPLQGEVISRRSSERPSRSFASLRMTLCSNRVDARESDVANVEPLLPRASLHEARVDLSSDK
jgi:hypothetical protein